MSNTQKEILIWGAGKMGRGFVADLFHSAGYFISFVDADQSLVKLLNERKRYEVIKATGITDEERVVVGSYQALHTSNADSLQQELDNCSLMALAVFPAIFNQVAHTLAPLLERRAASGADAPLDIIICANLLHAGSLLRSALENELSEQGRKFLSQRVGVVESLVIRIAVEPAAEMKQLDPLIVLTNGYPELTVDRLAFKCDPPEVAGIVPTETFRAEELRKIYTYNCLHATYAYLGKRKGYRLVSECFADPEIEEFATRTLEEVSRGLQNEFGFSAKQMEQWNARVVSNTANPLLRDTLARLGGNPIRKLQRDDRLVGPALLCRRNGVMPYYLTKAIANAFLFDAEGDEQAGELRAFTAEHSVKEAVCKYCDLCAEPDLVQLIADQYDRALGSAGLEEDSARVTVLRKAWESGFRYELIYHGCAQCLLGGMFHATGRNDPAVFQATSGLSGGIGLCGDGSCGGYTGGVMFMGMHTGRRLDKIEGDKEAQYDSYEMAQKLHDRFIEAYGSVACDNIHRKIFGRAYCLRTKEVRDRFEKAGAHNDKCTSVIATACAWVAEILLDKGI